MYVKQVNKIIDTMKKGTRDLIITIKPAENSANEGNIVPKATYQSQATHQCPIDNKFH